MNDFDSNLLMLINERESVLTEIERTIFTKRYSLSKKHTDIFSVQSIAMIYSIWEGFIQNSFNLYIEYLNNLPIKLTSFSDEIIVFHMESTFKQLHAYPNKSMQKMKYFNQLEDHFLKEHHSINSSINTESNVSFEVLNKLLNTFSLEKFPEHWNKYTYPNQTLKNDLKTFLRYRNGVAHGGDISSEEKVTQIVYSKYKKLIVDLMYALRDKFLDGIENKTYLKSN